MAKTHVYPRIDIHTKALTHSSVRPAAEDTTVLFVPLVTPKGPTKKVIPVHSLGEFISTFGALDYKTNGQTALNVYNWLSNGGTIYAYRLTGSTFKEADIYYKKYVFGNTNNIYYQSEDGYKQIDNSIFESIVLDNNDFNCVAITETAVSYASVDPATGVVYYSKTGDANNGFEYIKLIGSKVEGTTYYTLGITELTPSAVNIGTSRYQGDFYNSISVDVVKFSDTAVTINVVSVVNGVKTTLESYPRKKYDNLFQALESSEYIKFTNSTVLDNVIFDPITKELLNKFKGDNFKPGKVLYSFKSQNGTSLTGIVTTGNTSVTTTLSQNILLEAFWEGTEALEALGNKLETPIDLIMDAGYPKNVKLAMMKFINNGSVHEEYEDNDGRDDIVGIFDSYVLKGGLEAPIDGDESADSYSEATNIAIYDQYFTISDNTFTDRDIYVSPTYFLSKLIPYNDLHYGIQFPTAGTRRGVLEDVKAVNENPSPATKDDLFTNRINYVEKTAREYAFMNNRTHDASTEDSYTALSFLNNERCLEKMKKELEQLGRDYLFEFNDSVTLAQLSNVLNKYMNNWVSNRTLNYANVTVAPNPYLDEAVDVAMYVRFTSTIDVISVDITIE